MSTQGQSIDERLQTARSSCWCGVNTCIPDLKVAETVLGSSKHTFTSIRCAILWTWNFCLGLCGRYSMQARYLLNVIRLCDTHNVRKQYQMSLQKQYTGMYKDWKTARPRAGKSYAFKVPQHRLDSGSTIPRSRAASRSGRATILMPYPRLLVALAVAVAVATVAMTVAVVHSGDNAHEPPAHQIP